MSNPAYHPLILQRVLICRSCGETVLRGPMGTTDQVWGALYEETTREALRRHADATGHRTARVEDWLTLYPDEEDR